MTKKSFHIPCLRRNDTKQVLATRHGTVTENTQPELAFDPVKAQAFRICNMIHKTRVNCKHINIQEIKI
jgi:hypothetical protein